MITVWENKVSNSVLLSIAPPSFISSSILESVEAVSMLLVIAVLSLVKLAIKPFVLPNLTQLLIRPVSYVFPPVTPIVLSLSMTL
jgi:hypothetical protein